MIKKILISLILMLTLTISYLCIFQKKPDFFLNCDSYFSAPSESQYTFCLTYLYINHTIDFDQIYAIDFEGAQNVQITSFNFYALENNLKYNAIGLELNLFFSAPSVERCSNLILYYGDQNSYTYKIGNLVFDIGEKESSDLTVDIWNSPVASATTNFPYYYNIESNVQNLDNVTIQYSLDKTQNINILRNKILNGNITLDSNAPLKIIRPKLTFKTPSGSKVIYGNSCYCGALDITEDDVTLSYKYNFQKSK